MKRKAGYKKYSIQKKRHKNMFGKSPIAVAMPTVDAYGLKGAVVKIQEVRPPQDGGHADSNGHIKSIPVKFWITSDKLFFKISVFTLNYNIMLFSVMLTDHFKSPDFSVSSVVNNHRV